MIWIIGEYAERIDNADELLTTFLDGFSDENTQVQLQLLTAIVKLFLKRPTDTQELVQQVLSLATQDSDNPDLRDRGYIYWRLLSTDPAAAKVRTSHWALILRLFHSILIILIIFKIDERYNRYNFDKKYSQILSL